MNVADWPSKLAVMSAPSIARDVGAWSATWSPRERRTHAESLLRKAKEHLVRLRIGRARGALLGALVLDTERMQRAGCANLFVDANPLAVSREKFLAPLLKDDLSDYQPLAQRLPTYVAFERATSRLRHLWQRYGSLLQRRGSVLLRES